MRPILFSIGDLSFSSYFTVAALAYVVAALLITRRAERFGQNPVHYIDLVLFIGVGAFIGARLFHMVFVAPGFYLDNPQILLKFWYGGFVFYGGLIFGTLAGLLFARKKGLPVLLGLDIVAIPLALSMSIGRLSCFLAGCCYGKVCDLPFPFAVVFEVVDGVTPQARPLGEPLIPTQFLSSMLHLGIFFFLIYYQQRKRFHGALSAMLLIIYSVGRYIIEFLRNDVERGVYLNGFLSTSQIVAIFTFGLGVWLFFKGGRVSRAANAV